MNQATGNETACAFGAEFLWPVPATDYGCGLYDEGGSDITLEYSVNLIEREVRPGP